MCELTTIIAGVGALTAAAGTYKQIEGQNQAKKAQQEAVAAQIGAQRESRNQQLANIDAAGQQITADETAKTTATASQARDGAYSAATPAETGYLPGMGSAPQVVRDAVDQRRGVASGFVGQQAGALSNLGGWSDALFGVRKGIARAGQANGLEQSNARADTAMLPGQLAGAAFAGQGARAMGDLGVAAGTVTANNAGAIGNWYSGAPKPASTPATSAPLGGAAKGLY